jgi:hypothetical protein
MRSVMPLMPILWGSFLERREKVNRARNLGLMG